MKIHCSCNSVGGCKKKPQCWMSLNCVEIQYGYYFADVDQGKIKCKIQGKVKCKHNPYKHYKC